MATILEQSPAAGQPAAATNPTTPVLITGGSLVGLSAALFLGHQGVQTVVVERHLGSSLHPRAIGYTARTLELFRAVGLAEAIPQAPATFRLRRAKVDSLAGKWHEETPWTPEQAKAMAAKQPPGSITDYSPCTGASIAQDKLEPLLRERAQALGADIRLGTELVSFAQDATGVTATLRERATGREYELRAAYLVAADGTNSPVREALGIGRQGLGVLRTVRSVLFRAPLDEYLESGVHQFEVEQPGLSAFLTTYNDGRWVLMFTDGVERDEATLRDLIYRAIGRTDLPVEIITTGCWELSGLVTERFADGRVLLAGDAAHTLPPTRGGFGANTGIQDAHNLAWKLAAVLAGRATPALLATYDAERRPVAQVRYEQTFARPDYAAYVPADAPKKPLIDDMALEFGQLYRSAAVLGAGSELPAAQRPDQWAGQPGTRAPHLWLTRGSERLSTLDLLQPGWVLLADDAAWAPAAAQVAGQLGLDLTCVCFGVDIEAEGPGALPAALGLGRDGASLVRPDGYIAWRAGELPADPPAALLAALGRVAFAGHHLAEVAA